MPPSMYKARTFRKITSWVKAIVSKCTIDFNTKEDFRDQVTAIDHIINRLESSYGSTNLLMMITPSSKHQNLYKLHVIDRSKRKHLGMTSITSNELDKLKNSRAFKKYPFVFGTRYLDLETVALNSEAIPSLVSTVNGQCCKAWKRQPLRSKEITERNKFVDKSTSTLMEDFDLGYIKSKHHIDENKRITDKRRRKCNYKMITEKYIKTLMKSISSNIQPPNEDVERFFSIVEYLKFNIIIRPDFAYKSLKVNCKKGEHPIRFLLECYMPANEYIGSVALDTDILKIQLLTHPILLDNIRVVDDAFELVPLPIFLIRFIRNLCLYLCTEMILDMLGEFAYRTYLLIRNLKKLFNFFNFH